MIAVEHKNVHYEIYHITVSAQINALKFFIYEINSSEAKIN